MRIHPAFAPVIVFLFFTTFMIIGYFAFMDWESTVLILKFVGIVGIGAIFLKKAIDFLFPFTDQERSTPPKLINPRADTDLENGWVEMIDNSTRILHADGFAFELKNIRGRLHWREVDAYDRTPKESWLTANPKDVLHAGSESKVASSHIKWRVNGRKGIL